MTVHLERRGDIAIVTIDNPPVNAINNRVRERLIALAEALDADDGVKAVVLTGAGTHFVGGADITEFDKAVTEPSLPAVVARIEQAAKPWLAAIHGAALGGGLELALGCHIRVVGPHAALALPEVKLGIIPGSGGTQRLPRLIGAETAVKMVCENLTLDAKTAVAVGLADHLADGPLLDAAIDLAVQTGERPLPEPACRRSVAPPAQEVWEEAQARIERRARGASAPATALGVLRHGIEHGFAEGLRHERETFLKLRAGEEAAALRYLFFAERAAPRPPDLRSVETRPLASAGIVGGGTMGVGIAAALCNAGLPVVLIERDQESLARGLNALRTIVQTAAKKAGQPLSIAETRLAGVTGATDYAFLSHCDLVIEAVFEDLAVKRAVFADLCSHCRADAILATNTSYIDPGLIAEGLSFPHRFLGLHFFSPAQVMRLLEIVPIAETSREVLATAFDLARRLGKVPVRSGICDGFIGNRILRRYRAEAEAMILDGVEPQAIDAAMRDFGYAMGPFEMQDMAGLDISYLHRQAARARGETVPETPGDLLVQAGRKGQKTGAGWYDYAPGERMPRPSAEARRIIAPLVHGALEISAEAIVDRLIAALAEEGKAILDEGIAAFPADIDLVEVHGYGFPRFRGGPMFLTARAQVSQADGAMSPVEAKASHPTA
ncbi:3-hydroxyacyl-CoA dehydrogenase NAD-binding domain-containing protein [Rhizobium sp. SSA_523]|uniref:3-hydroxyacyl-CoA dehydrogenase NAD-binding domain-containing protein n=1 Tax=Rhizobium sp. SSA_523 TaxID=2952477 RepID=UPI002090D5A6|nr:3-hydroxyacyl-CoA dehydrogenase NAD-binding domain-containing protein [Rhizobium sp. SSA_523]MCO5731508.1 3-hydroxyacyl-CoA dehydrogenase NAD-binding domain-containing protein [Rhizobium sp. SSA_523]WKC21975.1 3-hydroxyacyl-CoA dehydrogenase NAD-binding domain-containing protein [Rhizobium sp. SSA_523]